MKILVVDLDDSLIKTDLLYESVFSLIKKNPFNVFLILKWYLTGGALNLKANIVKYESPAVEIFPYRKEIVELIKEKKSAGYQTVIASASPKYWVERVANHLGLFDYVIGTEKVNLKGKNKYEEIVKIVGVEKFEYIGDSSSDMGIWSCCGSAVLVNGSSKLENEVSKKATIVAKVKDPTNKLKVFIKQMRVHQWSKNSLLFLPMLAGHKFDFDLILQCFIGLIAFSFSASAVYIINDLIDIDSDRKHHTKRNRPLAAGTLSIKYVIWEFALLVLLSIILALYIGNNLLLVILLYWVLNFFYTFYFKKEVILDIILLSGMYSIRIFAGAEATSLPVSDWLLSFSTIFFFSLACVKRYTEIIRSQNKLTLDGRGYRRNDNIAVLSIGVGSGLLSIVVVLLYMQSTASSNLYTHSNRLWMLTPLLLYWVSRLWLLTIRDELHDDPVIFAIKDKKSWICFAGIIAVMVSAL